MAAVFSSAYGTGWHSVAISRTWQTVPACFPRKRSPVAASTKLSNEVVCLGIGNPPMGSGMHESLVCAHAVVPKFPRELSRQTSTNSIFCGGCSSWIYKKCSGTPGPLKSDASLRCKRCTGQAKPLDGRLMAEVTVGREKLEVVPSFCYLGDFLSSGGGCELATITRCRVAWGKFNKPLFVLTSRSFPITSRGRDYNLCVRSAMLHASENWAPILSDWHRLQRNERAMIRWICSVTTKDKLIPQDLLERMQLDGLA